jgi:hypothetical protein
MVNVSTSEIGIIVKALQQMIDGVIRLRLRPNTVAPIPSQASHLRERVGKKLPFDFPDRVKAQQQSPVFDSKVAHPQLEIPQMISVSITTKAGWSPYLHSQGFRPDIPPTHSRCLPSDFRVLCGMFRRQRYAQPLKNVKRVKQQYSPARLELRD